MGLFDKIFSSKGEDSDVKLRQKSEDNAIVKGDRFVHTEDGGHVHSSYTLDTASGGYKEYHGGEDSPDRSYNK